MRLADLMKEYDEQALAKDASFIVGKQASGRNSEDG